MYVMEKYLAPVSVYSMHQGIYFGNPFDKNFYCYIFLLMVNYIRLKL